MQRLEAEKGSWPKPERGHQGMGEKAKPCGSVRLENMAGTTNPLE